MTMLVLYLKEECIDDLSPEIAMVYRMAAFTNTASGNRPRRLAFDNAQRIQTFLSAFPEIAPYIIDALEEEVE